MWNIIKGPKEYFILLNVHKIIFFKEFQPTRAEALY